MQVEIVIATYPGGERYLQETVDSFVEQGVQPSIVNDNRSTDEKWNEAIDECESDYLCLAHHDDAYLPNYLEEMTGFLDAHPECIAAFCLDYLIDESGKRIGQTPDTPDPLDTYTFADIFSRMTRAGNILRCETVVLRKSMLKGLRYPDRSLCGSAHDTQFWFMLLDRAPIGIVQKRLVKYRIHPESDTQKNVVGKSDIGHLKALEFAANLRPLDVDFSAHIFIAKGLKQAEEQIEVARIRARSAEGNCEFLVSHEPPDNAGTGVVVAERARRLNRSPDGRTRYYVYPKNGGDAEVRWQAGVPVIECSSNAFADIVARFKPELIEYHHLLRWPFDILRAPCPRKELFLHDSFLWCAAYHSFNVRTGEVCNSPSPEKCLACVGITPEQYKDKRQAVADGLKQMGRIVANSSYTAEYFAKNYGLSCEVVHPHGPELERARASKRVGYFGGFLPVKGVQVLLKAMRVLPDIQLLMFCDVPAEWLDGRRLVGYPNVVVMGRYSRTDLPGLVLLVDIGVVPSINESFGLVKRELEELCLPVISTNTGGLDGAVPPGDACALAEAIRAAL